MGEMKEDMQRVDVTQEDADDRSVENTERDPAKKGGHSVKIKGLVLHSKWLLWFQASGNHWPKRVCIQVLKIIPVVTVIINLQYFRTCKNGDTC